MPQELVDADPVGDPAARREPEIPEEYLDCRLNGQCLRCDWCFRRPHGHDAPHLSNVRTLYAIRRFRASKSRAGAGQPARFAYFWMRSGKAVENAPLEITRLTPAARAAANPLVSLCGPKAMVGKLASARTGASASQSSGWLKSTSPSTGSSTPTASVYADSDLAMTGRYSIAFNALRMRMAKNRSLLSTTTVAPAPFAATGSWFTIHSP